MSDPAADREALDEKPSGPRSRKGADTRARLVAAAKSVFEDHGFLDARISDISQRAGLSHGSFYHYFESKEAVFLEVAEAQDQKFGRGSLMTEGIAAGATPDLVAERLGAAIRAFLSEYRDAAPIMGVIEQVSRSHEPVRGARLTRYRHQLDLAAESIGELQRRGWVDPTLDPDITSAALVASITRFAELWFVQANYDFGFDEGVDQLTRFALNVLQLGVAHDGATQPQP